MPWNTNNRPLPRTFICPRQEKEFEQMTPDNWTPPHSHDPSPNPPGNDSTLTLYVGLQAFHLTSGDLAGFPQSTVNNCYIVSTGHGTSGPFAFEGVQILELTNRYTNNTWVYINIISDDGFRTRLTRAALATMGERPVLLALKIDGRPMRRNEGLIRLIVPNEKEDALQQVKWVSDIRVY